MRTDSLAFRLVAGTALWGAIVLVGAGIGLAALFRGSAERAFDARLEVYLEALVAAASEGQPPTLSDPRFEQVYSGWYWQIGVAEGGRLRSRSLWDVELPSPGDAFIPGPDGQRLRRIARTITLPGASGGELFQVAGETAALEAEIDLFNAVLAGVLGAIAAVVLGAMLVQVRTGLLPFRRLHAALAAVREGTAARIGGSYPAELAPVVAELNAVLDHNAEVVERARTHVGNLAHALKTPLAVLHGEAGAAGGPSAAVVGRQSAAMHRLVDHHLRRARTAARAGLLDARTELAPVAVELCRALSRIYAARELDTAAEVPAGLTVAAEREDVEEMLGNLLDNACKWARAKVRLRAEAAGQGACVTVEDDGDGVAADDLERAVERGRRLDEAAPGSGLGLAIVRDTAELYGGALTLDRAPLGGLRATLRLPR